MAIHSFTAVLIRPEGVGTWTYLNIPPEISATFSYKGQVKVKGTINGCPYRSTALPHGDGSHYLVVAKNIRDQIHASQGDSVQVTLELDSAERKVEVPEILAAALHTAPQSKANFERMSYSHQKAYVNWILEARRDETRQNRVEKVLELLAQGKPVR